MKGEGEAKIVALATVVLFSLLAFRPRKCCHGLVVLAVIVVGLSYFGLVLKHRSPHCVNLSRIINIMHIYILYEHAKL